MTRIYPGMLCKSKEYFNSGPNVMMIHDGIIQNFDDVPDHPELAEIIADEKDLHSILKEWYGDDERMKQKTLAKCRFGALNFFADFNGDEATPDYVECPLRGSCKGENIICKPATINGEPASPEEIKILQAVSTDDTNKAIAEKLGYPLGTFNVKKTNLYQKFGLTTKQHAVITLLFEGLMM